MFKCIFLGIYFSKTGSNDKELGKTWELNTKNS